MGARHHGRQHQNGVTFVREIEQIVAKAVDIVPNGPSSNSSIRRGTPLARGEAYLGDRSARRVERICPIFNYWQLPVGLVQYATLSS
jgi:hypothetical protein